MKYLPHFLILIIIIILLKMIKIMIKNLITVFKETEFSVQPSRPGGV